MCTHPTPIPPVCVKVEFYLSCSHPFQAIVEIYEKDSISSDDFLGKLNLNSKDILTASDWITTCVTDDEMFSSGFKFYFTVTKQTCVEPSWKFAKEHQYYPDVGEPYFYNLSVYWRLDADRKLTFIEHMRYPMHLTTENLWRPKFEVD